MRVLLLSYHFPPDQAVGGLRPAKLARALQSRGHDVTVIAATETIDPGWHGDVLRVRPLKNPREWYLQLKRRASRKAASDAAHSVAVAAYAPPARPARLKRYVMSALWLPDDRQGFIPAAYGAAERLHVEAPFDLVYTSAPPFSTQLAGLLIHTMLGVRWIAEYRDPWLDGRVGFDHVRSAGVDRIARWLEDCCLRAASEVVTVTESTAQLLGTRRAALNRRAPIVALNGIDHLAPTPAPRSGPIHVLYLGDLYLGRDPRPFLTALAELRKGPRWPRNDVVVEFVGECRWFRGESIEAMAIELGLQSVVQFHDRVPFAQIDRFLCRADILLLLAQRQPRQVPNKLYDYLGSGRHVLAFVDSDGETATMLSRAGGHIVVTERDDPARVTELVACAIDSCRDPLATDVHRLQEWTTERQMTLLVDRLMDVG